jgi:hypothetical protein
MLEPTDWSTRWGVARAALHEDALGPGQGWMHAFDRDQVTVACGLHGQGYTVFRGAYWLDSRLTARCPRCADIVSRWVSVQVAGPRAKQMGDRMAAWAARRPLRNT